MGWEAAADEWRVSVPYSIGGHAPVEQLVAEQGTGPVTGIAGSPSKRFWRRSGSGAALDGPIRPHEAVGGSLCSAIPSLRPRLRSAAGSFFIAVCQDERCLGAGRELARRKFV